MDLRHGGGHADVALIGYGGNVTCFRAGKIAARKPNFRGQEFSPQCFSGSAGQTRRIIGIRNPDFLCKKPADILS